MQRKMVKPIYLFVTIFMIISLACGGTTKVSTQTTAISATPKPSLTLLPTYTPYPTYTPRPIPTRKLTQPAVTATSTEQISPTDVFTGTTPINCVPSPASGYNTCIDDTGTIKVDVPDTWTDVNGGKWIYNGRDIGVAISAAPSLDKFPSSLKSEGVFFGASGTFAQIIGHIELLDYYTMAYHGSCTYIGRFYYDDGLYRGKYDMYKNCGGEGGYDAYILGAREKAEPSTKLILVEIQAYPGDVSARDKIWSTFFIIF